MGSDKANIDDLYLAALEKQPGEARSRYLDEACGDDSALRARVERLLAAQPKAEGFFESPAPGINLLPTVDQPTQADPAADSPPHDRRGARIGPYKLLQPIGEGGMGVVYMAEQTEPVRRRVALKVIKPGMDSREVIARFEAERQALALMDHPNIAKVLDAGTTQEGRPYFVMEFVNGLPLTEYCDENQLTTRERLRLFVSVCRGVQHAHQKGVIHRDLKPSNILVAEYDHDAIPKVIDFGIAKATNQQLTDKTLFTQFGQIIGTLEYMSPEQAKRNQLDVDTRSDVYSLGVVLYELLTGQTPFDRDQMRAAALDEMLRIIREDDPPLPSLKLSTSNEIGAIAACRRVEPNRLPAIVRGDLDWIVLKTLQKDRSDRYGNTAELADDLSRHLDCLPIQAGPPRLATRLRKFVTRNAWQTTIAITTVAVLMIAIVWYVRSTSIASERIAQRSRRVSEAIDSASLSLGLAIKSPISSTAEWIAAETGLQRLDDQLAEGPVSSDVSARAKALFNQADEARLDRDLSLRMEDVLITSASHQDLESWQRMEAEIRQILADNGFDLDNEPPQVIAKRMREHPFSSRFCDILELWIGTLGHMGSLGGPRATRESLRPWTQALYAADPDSLRTGIREVLYGDRPPTQANVRELTRGIDLQSRTPRTLSWLSIVYNMAKLPAEANQVYEDAIHWFPGDVMLTFDYALLLSYQGRPQEALRMYARAVALRPNTAGLWQMMGIELTKVDELDNARKAFERARDLESDYGPIWIHLGDVYLQQNEVDQALNAGRTAMELSPQHPGGYGIAGRALMRQGNLAEAQVALETCVELAAKDRSWKEPSDQWLEDCKQQRSSQNK